MIISASYKTDIPAFYGDWFINRLRAGYCKVINPYNRRISRVSLVREEVDGFVFWTKNLGPFRRHLRVVRDLEYPFVIQHTINGYPRTLEHSVVNWQRAISHLREVAETYGKRVAVWRYDPIVISSVTDFDFHRRVFPEIAKGLEGATDEVVISFAQMYKKTQRNMDVAARKSGFSWQDPTNEEKVRLVEELAQVASAFGIQAKICSQPEFLGKGLQEARCVDADRISHISGSHLASKLQGNRPQCGCFASKDIGEYDTCPHGCVYCYAVMNRDLAKARFAAHDPTSEFLFAPVGQFTEDAEEQSWRQLKLL